MKKTQIPTFANKAEQFDWLISNKSLLIAEKKATTKEADSILFTPEIATKEAIGAEKVVLTDDGLEINKISAKLVINTTNVMDSHMDVHIPGIWKKSLNEQTQFYLTQEHELTFDHIITDNVKAYTKSLPWATLKAPFDGNTEALMFDVVIDESRNEFMFEQYANRYVKNHSVGMRYVKIFLCINDTRYGEEKANWDKYITEVANRSVAEEYGYFWAVTEAKIIEGSAVVLGSNPWTPTLSQVDDTTEPMNDSASPITPSAKTEPLDSTQNTDTPIVKEAKGTFLNPNLY